MGKNRKRSPDTSTPIWDALLGLAASVGQVNNITSMLVPFLQNAELLNKLSDRERFMRLASTLDRDLRQMTSRYQAIYSQHADRHGSSADANAWMQAIDLHEQYIAWAADFDDVIRPTFFDMMSMLADAGADTSQVSVPSASEVASQFNN